MEVIQVTDILFGDSLRQARCALGLSQSELARLAGVSQGLISQIELGKNQDTKAGIALRIARVIHERRIALAQQTEPVAS
jgi:predicted transcriptional regulator